jgi:hypothetical protein
MPRGRFAQRRGGRWAKQSTSACCGNFDGALQWRLEVDGGHQQGENRKLGGDDGDDDGTQLAGSRILVLGSILLHIQILLLATNPAIAQMVPAKVEPFQYFALP